MTCRHRGIGQEWGIGIGNIFMITCISKPGSKRIRSSVHFAGAGDRRRRSRYSLWFVIAATFFFSFNILGYSKLVTPEAPAMANPVREPLPAAMLGVGLTCLYGAAMSRRR
jgi:hypothetical protein